MSSNENKSGPDEDLLLEHRRQNEIYNRLYVLGKSLNEQLSEGELFDIAGKFVTGDLGYERCILFKHDDRNGWFKIDMAIGYQNPAEQKVLKIINLLLSGAVIEYLRKIGQPIIHSQENPNEIVRDLTKSLFLREAYFELFGGDVEIPYGLIVIGNGLKSSDKDFTSIEFDSMSRLALGNFITQFSNTINNIVFYQAWKIEKASLEENIIKRTRELTAQKETFEAIYKTSKDGIAILDVETTAFLDVNPAYAEMTGYTIPELLLSSCMKLSIPEDQIRARKAIEEILQKGYITNFEKTCIAKDGSHVITNMSIVLMKDRQRMLASVKDITNQKKLEKNLIIERNVAEKANEELVEVYKQIQDSISYASLIQHALMPSESLFQSYFQDYFIHWEPKDVVGGDIYFFEILRDEEESLLMSIDCTGHGVPGAFVTMLVKAVERQIISKLKNQAESEISTSWVLQYFNKNVKKLLKQDKDASLSDAGFDGAIVYIDRKKGILKFSGAHSSLFFLKDGLPETIKGCRHSIGYTGSSVDFQFREHTLSIQPGMQFYLSTDGFFDQMGGEKGLPLGKKKFLQVLRDHQSKPFSELKSILLKLLYSHQGDCPRNDDITLIGVKI